MTHKLTITLCEDITYGDLAAAYALPLPERETDALRTDAPPGWASPALLVPWGPFPEPRP